MKKTLFAILMIFSLFILSGCNDSNSNVGPSTTPFVGGSNALSLSFMDGAPPAEVFDNGDYAFGISIKMENLGEDDVETQDGYLEITGIDAQEFGLNGQSDLRIDFPSELKGVKKNSEGTITVSNPVTAEFGELNYEGDSRGNFNYKIRATACYNYETEATTLACLKRDMLTNINTKEVCDLNGDKPVYNSGGPIQITKVTQTPVGSEKIQLTFEISHVGEADDRFYKLDTDCNDRATNQDKDLVYFEVLSTEGDSLGDAQCTGLRKGSQDSEGYIELFNGAPRTVVCTFDTSNVEGIFEKKVNAKISYRYSQFIEKNILVKDVSSKDD